MKKYTILLVLVLAYKLGFSQLDVPYSQYLFNQNPINPAYNGVHDVMSLNFNVRQQWLGVEGHPQSYLFNAHTSFLHNKVAAGLILQSDQYGITSINEVHANYAYLIDTGDGILSMGLQTGFVNFQNDYTKLNIENPDPNFPQIVESFSKPNFGAGLFYSHRSYYVGFSIPRFLNITYDDGTVVSSRYRRHFYLSGGYVFEQMFNFKIRPSFLYRQVAQGFSTLDINVSAFINEQFWVGMTLTDFGQAFGINANMEFNDRYRAGLSGTLSGGTLAGGNVGSFEVMIAMDLEVFNRQAAGNRYY